MHKCVLAFVLCGLVSFQLWGQKKKIEDLNSFIDGLNAKIDYINSEQLVLQQYHQDVFRFYRIFDTLTFKPYTKTSFRNDDLKAPNFIEKEYAQLDRHFVQFDSILNAINYQEDMAYSEEKIEAMNTRVELFKELSQSMQEDIENIDLAIGLQNNLSTKKAYELMLQEMKKVEFYVRKFKRKKLELHEIDYTIPVKLRKKLPPSYLAILEEFLTRVQECSEEGSKATIIHYFIPEKYFDKWILKKYTLRYWQAKYLEDIIINPKFEIGLKTNYNSSVKDQSLKSLKNIDSYESLPFEYVPQSNSPFGRHKKVFLILILDISNSMNENYKLDQLKLSVKKIVDAIRPQDKISIILFSNVSQELVLPSERDTEYIKYLIDQITAFGNTLPESAIFRSYNILNLQSNKDFDNEVILITDGVFDVTGKMKYHINQGKRIGTNFSIINIENGGENYKDLKKLTEISDGKLYFIQDDATYDTIIEEVLRD